MKPELTSLINKRFMYTIAVLSSELQIDYIDIVKYLGVDHYQVNPDNFSELLTLLDIIVQMKLDGHKGKNMKKTPNVRDVLIYVEYMYKGQKIQDLARKYKLTRERIKVIIAKTYTKETL